MYVSCTCTRVGGWILPKMDTYLPFIYNIIIHCNIPNIASSSNVQGVLLYEACGCPPGLARKGHFFPSPRTTQAYD